MSENDTTEKYNEPLPDNWSKGIAISSSNHYSMWYYQNNDEYELHIWWDKGNAYHTEIIPIDGFDENGDPKYGYAIETCAFDTLREAEEYAWGLMEIYA